MSIFWLWVCTIEESISGSSARLARRHVYKFVIIEQPIDTWLYPFVKSPFYSLSAVPVNFEHRLELPWVIVEVHGQTSGLPR